MQVHVHFYFHFHFRLDVPKSHPHPHPYIPTSTSTLPHRSAHTWIGPSETVGAVPAAQLAWLRGCPDPRLKPNVRAHGHTCTSTTTGLHYCVVLPQHTTTCSLSWPACMCPVGSEPPASSLPTTRLVRTLYPDWPRPRQAGPALVQSPRPHLTLTLTLSGLTLTDGTCRQWPHYCVLGPWWPGFWAAWCCAVYLSSVLPPPSAPRRLPHLCPPRTHSRPIPFPGPEPQLQSILQCPRP